MAEQTQGLQPPRETGILRQWLTNLISAVIQGMWIMTWRPEAWERGMNYKFNRESPTTMPPEDSLMRARALGVIGQGDYHSAMLMFGYSPEASELLYRSYLKGLTIEQALRLYFRKEINDEELSRILEANGVNPAVKDKIVKAEEYYPSPADLITFAVREAYSRDAIEKFRTLEGLPEEFLRDAEKVGLRREWAEKYWIAHWRLPSVEQGFEMLHRGVITWEELEILLRALDIMPYFRDKLLKISYNPYTRVDTRRMYAMGVLTEEEVYKNFRDLGYDDEHAKKMTEWVKLTVLEDVKTISKSQIQELWEVGDLTDEDAVRLLQKIGYDEASASLIKTLWEHEKSNKNLKAEIDALETLYVEGAVGYDEFYDSLCKLGLSSRRLQSILVEAERKRRSKMKIPSKDDLLKWLKFELIDYDEYFERMTQLGYSREDALRYIASDVKLPSKGDLDKMFKAKLITEEEYIEYMRKLKYSDKEIEKYLTLLYKEMGVETEVGA